MGMKQLKKMAIKKTIKQAKAEVVNLKRKGKKIDNKKFEKHVKDLYSNNLKNLVRGIIIQKKMLNKFKK